jgi:hypothetical protein
MNEIEQKFYDAWCEYGEEESIQPGKVIGPYRVDFLAFDYIVIEIDGHDSHKTKEQRDKDYKRERFLQKEGNFVVRFTGTEVFLDSDKCVEEVFEIKNRLDQKDFYSFESGIKSGKKLLAKNISEIFSGMSEELIKKYVACEEK